jgi:chloramphenicol O-acetyltransferase
MGRRDAYKVKDIHGVQNILIDFKPNRCDSAVYMNRKIDMTNFVKFIKKKKEEIEGLTYYHGIVDVMAKTIYSRPYMNRFIAGRTMYMHKDVSLAQTIKVEFEDNSVEMLMVLNIDPEDTLEDISRKTKEKVDIIRQKKLESKGNANGAADTLGNLPKFIRVPIVEFMKFLDSHGMLPKSITDDNLYYSSAILSNIGTFKVGAIYHNLTNFGTASSLITFGEIVEENGRWYMEMGATIDERIADGFYFCKALKLIEYIFDTPELMLEPAGKKVSIPENRK